MNYQPSPNLHALGFLLLVFCITGSACARYSTHPTSSDPEPSAPANAITLDFENDPVGKVPAGYTLALTGGGGPVRWEVQETADAPSGMNVLSQLSSDKTNTRYPNIVFDGFSATEVDVSVKFKTISGKVDASGGIVFRYLDKDNFYVVRANSLENNVVAYKTENGKRSAIGIKGDTNAYGVEIEVPHQEWNSLRVIAKGVLFQFFLNGRKIFESEDRTFFQAGKIGLWTKADAVTQFDDLTFGSLAE